MRALQLPERGKTVARAALLSPLALVVVLLGSVVIRSILASRIDGPQVPCDEFIYAQFARNLAEHGSYMFRGSHTLVSLLYPMLIAPAWFARSMQTTYTIAKTINVVVMTLSAIPVYFWTRRLAGGGWALAAATVTLLMPDFHFTALLMTEAAFLPAFLLATYLIALAIEDPTVWKQAFAVLATLVAIGVRLEGICIVPVLPMAIVIAAALDAWVAPAGERRDTLRRRLVAFWPTLAMLVGLGIAYIVAAVATGSRAPGFGFYEGNATRHYVLRAALSAAVAQLEGVLVLSGIVTVSALILLAFLVRSSPRPVRIFTTVAVLSSFWLLLEVGALKGDFAYERYTFYLTPLFVIALFVWIGMGMPRPLVPTAIAIAVPVYLVLQIPDRLYALPIVPNYFGFFAFFRFASSTASGGPPAVHWWVAAAALFSGVFFAFVVRPVAILVIPAAVAGFLLITSIPAFGLLRQQAYGSRYAPSVGRDAQWIDNKIGTGADATFLYTPAGYPFETSLTMLETEFWNSSVRSVANVGGREVCAIPEENQTIQPTGSVVALEGQKPFQPDYVVADPALRPNGQVVARRPSLVVYRTHSPVRMFSTLDGVYRDGWTGPFAAYTRWPSAGPAPKTADVVLSRAGVELADAPSTVITQLWKGTAAGTGKPLISKVATIHMKRRLVYWFRLPPTPFHLEVHFTSPFSPAQLGQPDTRALGAKLRITLLPRGVRASDPAPPGTP